MPILGFGSRVFHLVLLSRCSVRDFSSGLFLQLHLVVVYSDVVVTPALLCSTLLLRQRGSLPQLGLLSSRKLSGILCHCVVQHHCVKLDPPVSLTSLAE